MPRHDGRSANYSTGDMKRIDLPEIEDQPWCPGWLRWVLTAYLKEAIRASGAYDASAPSLSELIASSSTPKIVDLCSGGGGPWPELLDRIDLRFDQTATVTLTDLYPEPGNRPGTDDDRVSFHPAPVAADAVPADLSGIRTMFTALHHFNPPEVERILGAAQRDGVGFAAFEATHRSLKGLLVTLLIPLLVLLLIPRVRPVRWFSLVLTYLIPIVPIAVWWDGFASTLRTYREREIREMIERLPVSGYTWAVAEVRTGKGPLPMLQIIGRPNRRENSSVLPRAAE